MINLRIKKEISHESSEPLLLSESENSDSILDVFQKQFTIADNDNYQLPEPETMFTEDSWYITELLSHKKDLNKLKERLSRYDRSSWRSHTFKMNKAEDIFQTIKEYVSPELCTRAWCKFYEIACSYPLVPLELVKNNDNSFTSVHLCEAPGAFVASLNHWLKTFASDVSWNWLASTLNPYYEGNLVEEVITDDRFLRQTLGHWCFGTDYTGNLMNRENLDCIVDMSKETCDKVLLVTADGSIDCVNMPDEQESAVRHLHFCELVAALRILSNGGNFLLKIFTMFEYSTVCLLYLLSCLFAKVDIKKPATSKPGNSELYVVCLNFQGRDRISSHLSVLMKYYGDESNKAMFCESHIPNKFRERIVRCSKFFMEKQSEEIWHNIITYQDKKAIPKDLKAAKHKIRTEFLKNYKVKLLDIGESITDRNLLKMRRPVRKDSIWRSYEDYEKWKSLNTFERLKKLFSIALDVTFRDSVLTFTCMSPCQGVSIVIGKQYDKIKSSEFCDKKLLQCKNIMEDILEKNNIHVRFPMESDVNNFVFNYKLRKRAEGRSELTKHQGINDTENKCGILIFDYSRTHCLNVNRKTFTVFNASVRGLKKGQSLYLAGYSLLTQFNVGVFCLFMRLFKRVHLITDRSLGCIIHFERYKKRRIILRQMFEITLALSKAKQENKSVISVLPMSTLQDSSIYAPIVSANNRILSAHMTHVLRQSLKTIERSYAESATTTTNSQFSNDFALVM